MTKSDLLIRRLRVWATVLSLTITLVGLMIRAVKLILPLLGQLSAAAAVAQTPQPVCAPFGEHKRIELREHSWIDLDSAACVTIEISARQRLIKLDFGEAVFQVTADPRRPFVVETGPIAITALGTQFDVFRRTASTRVAVVEGAVQISSRDTASRSSGKPLTMLQQIDGLRTASTFSSHNTT